MSYEIKVSRKKEKTNSKVVRDDIVMSSKVTVYEGIGGTETIVQGGLISFPYEDLPKIIKKLEALQDNK